MNWENSVNNFGKTAEITITKKKFDVPNRPPVGGGCLIMFCPNPSTEEYKNKNKYNVITKCELN